MARYFKVFRFVAFYALFWMVAASMVSIWQNWHPLLGMLFLFLLPGILSWMLEKRRAAKRAAAKPVTPPPKPPAKSATTKIARPELKQDAQPIVTQIPRAATTSTSYLPPSSPTAASPKSPTEVKPRAKTGWVSADETVTIAGRKIKGMVYVGTPPRLNSYGYNDKVRAFIDPSLSIAKFRSDIEGDMLGYWPNYSEISPVCRATYLDWLASGKRDANHNPGYMFLYFYGLERRFFLDSPDMAERRAIVTEVDRLRALYPDNHSVQRYLGEFLSIARVAINDPSVHEPKCETRSWDLPYALKVAIGARVGRDEPLSADWLFAWFMCHPERQIRTAATRCADEFRALFAHRFDARFPKGLKVPKPRKILSGEYRAASSEFTIKLDPTINGSQVKDISGVRKPIEVAQEIADEVMDDLGKLSRYLGRNPDRRDSLEAQALVPPELWAQFPSAALDNLTDWAQGVVADGGLIPVADVVARLEGARPDKLTKTILINTADALARIGIGLAPDPRHSIRGPKLGEPVVLYDLGERVAALEDVSDDYRTALIELALAAFVIHADGHVNEAERETLRSRADAVPNLSAQERRRLLADVDWMLAVAPDLSLLKRRLNGVTPEAHGALRAALVAAAHADGILQSEEVQGIDRIYKVLGLDPEMVYSDLHAGTGPITVRPATPGAPGEGIPPEVAPRSPALDPALIAAIKSDTQRVAGVLGGIFGDDTMDEAEPPASPSTSRLDGLDEKHTSLVAALIAQDHWDEDGITALCAEIGLLPAGAVEAINEWSFDHYDEALIDDYEGYDIAADIAIDLKTKLKPTGAAHVQT